MTMSYLFVYPLFFFSGFAALVYEIIWSKQLSLVYGTTLPALSVVTATFMAGLALGNAYFGRRVDRSLNPMRFYALVELAIALSAGIIPLLLPEVSKLYVFLVQGDFLPPAMTHVVRLLLSALIILPTATLIGATLPAMCRIVVTSLVDVRFGRLYALNTLGAVTGCLAVAYTLIPNLGLSASNGVAVMLNAAIGLTALLLSRKRASVVPLQEKMSNIPGLPSDTWLLFGCVALQGAFFLAYEILWTRVFLQFLGNTTYAFATMLAAFLVGLSCGSAIYSRWLKKFSYRRQLFFWLFCLSGVSILVSAPYYDLLFYLFDEVYFLELSNWGTLSTLLLLCVAIPLIIPTALSGATLPAALAILSPEEPSVGTGTGRLLFWNTLGAIIGSIAGGFFLINNLGILNSFRAAATINIFAALIYLAKGVQDEGKRPLKQALIIALISAFFWVPTWNQLLINSGTYIYTEIFKGHGGMQRYLDSQTLEYLAEGNEATVALVSSSVDGTRSIKINGKVDGSDGSRDMITMTLIGQLPALLHPAPHNALHIGVGTGITLAQLAYHDIPDIDVLEISPEVIETAMVFDPNNRKIFDQQGINLKIDDGRNWLLTHDRQYDLIVSQPSNPWQSGNANLFTHEFYQLVNRRLAPNGIFCQWIPLYDLSPQHVNVALRTLLETFPHLRVFVVNESEIVLLCTHDPLPWDNAQIERRIDHPRVTEHLAAIGIKNANDILREFYFCDEWPLKALSAKAELNSDNHPVLEFSRRAERMHTDWPIMNMQMLLEVRRAFEEFKKQRRR